MHPDPLVNGLLDPSAYPHRVQTPVELIETHISWVFLTGEFVYKVKKPVRLEFLDFTDLEQRKYFCNEELRLNRRLAPQLYLDVVSIGGSRTRPAVGANPAIDHAVQMRQFPQRDRLDRCLERGELSVAELESAAGALAAFHRQQRPVVSGSEFGSIATIRKYVDDNIAELEGTIAGDEPLSEAIRDVCMWSTQWFERGGPVLQQRQAAGMIRDCHGDLHLENMVRMDGEVVMFDCLEFAEPLRIIDVISELAFVAMDLCARGHEVLAWGFINVYLQLTGDYAGIAVLRFYMVYRAMVRAKVAVIRCGQAGEASLTDPWLIRYARFAEAQIRAPRTPHLVITHGLSGSGKSYWSKRVAAALPAIHLRSDLERKRLQGLPPTARSHLDVGAGYYGAAATEQTYTQLMDLAALVIRQGYNVVVDATFLERDGRSAARELARTLQVPLTIIDCHANESILRQRVGSRARDLSEASEADIRVLENQLRHQDPLRLDELRETVRIDTGDASGERLDARLGQILHHVHRAGQL